MKNNIQENKLSYKERKGLSKKSFAIPSKRKYPIEDKAHAKNALARVSQNGTPSEKAEVRAKVHKKFPSLGKKHESIATQPLHTADRKEKVHKIQGPVIVALNKRNKNKIRTSVKDSIEFAAKKLVEKLLQESTDYYPPYGTESDITLTGIRDAIKKLAVDNEIDQDEVGYDLVKNGNRWKIDSYDGVAWLTVDKKTGIITSVSTYGSSGLGDILDLFFPDWIDEHDYMEKELEAVPYDGSEEQGLGSERLDEPGAAPQFSR